MPITFRRINREPALTERARAGATRGELIRIHRGEYISTPELKGYGSSSTPPSGGGGGGGGGSPPVPPINPILTPKNKQIVRPAFKATSEPYGKYNNLLDRYRRGSSRTQSNYKGERESRLKSPEQFFSRIGVRASSRASRPVIVQKRQTFYGVPQKTRRRVF